MMSKFIELHDGMQPISINVDSIEWFADETISMHNSEIKVIESYEEIKQLILDAGVLIHKADPRLDTTTPLTMDALRDMEGQPVWNSNSLKWMIVNRFVDAEKDLAPIVWFVRDDGQFTNMVADDLIKYPLYRMRQ